MEKLVRKGVTLFDTVHIKLRQYCIQRDIKFYQGFNNALAEFLGIDLPYKERVSEEYSSIPSYTFDDTRCVVFLVFSPLFDSVKKYCADNGYPLSIFINLLIEDKIEGRVLGTSFNKRYGL